ncbi:helix-turn-helix domain-containing protein [Bradyrhizobium sp. USDA 4501]
MPLADRLSLSPEEASALSGIGLTRIREAVASGALEAHKHGIRTIILPDDLKAWLKAMPLASEQKSDRPE